MKKHPLVSYITKLSFFSIAVCFIAFFAMLFFRNNISTNTPYYIVLFYLCTAIGYALTYISVNKKTMKFEHIFMLVKFGKLFIYLIVFLAIIMLEEEKEKIMPFVISYLGLYALYLIFDTITYKNFSKKI
ncbi:MAG: hypothetical protein WC135_03765 [Bacteroidales bacterium]